MTKFDKNVGKAKPVEDLLRFVITVMKSDFDTNISRNIEQISNVIRRQIGAHMRINSNYVIGPLVIGKFVIGQFVVGHLSFVRSNSAKNTACQEPTRFVFVVSN